MRAKSTGFKNGVTDSDKGVEVRKVKTGVSFCIFEWCPYLARGWGDCLRQQSSRYALTRNSATQCGWEAWRAPRNKAIRKLCCCRKPIFRRDSAAGNEWRWIVI